MEIESILYSGVDRFRRRISDYSYDKIRVLSNLL